MLGIVILISAMALSVLWLKYGGMDYIHTKNENDSKK
jgi:hypothetical protein